jgi:hypothetical protein
MKKSRYTEEQIVGVLKESEAGLETGGVVPQVRHQPADVLSLEGEVRRFRSQRGTAATAFERGRSKSEETGGRTSAGHRRLQEGVVKKTEGPQMDRWHNSPLSRRSAG